MRLYRHIYILYHMMNQNVYEYKVDQNDELNTIFRREARKFV